MKLYIKNCRFCGKKLESPYKKQVDQWMEMHEKFCKKKQTKLGGKNGKEESA